MISTGELRDAQIEAIKTYLFFKIACDNKPLYNGDRTLTDFRIRCYKKNSGKNSWANVGEYTPDFIILQRKAENEVGKVLIVETKGSLYANDPNFIVRREFVEQYFIKMNNEKTGAEKFSYLYLQDNESDEEWIKKTISHVNAFFGEEM